MTLFSITTNSVQIISIDTTNIYIVH